LYISRCRDWITSGRPGFLFRQGRNFLSATRFLPAQGANPASCPVGVIVLSSVAKQQKCEANHSHPFSAKFKIAWRSNSTFPYAWRGS
jgi:hypothetical protein